MIAALAEQVISLLDSEERAHRLATAGRQAVEQTFSAETFAANILELYERVLHRNSRREYFRATRKAQTSEHRNN
jgi:glycosyltransferase involved in cell wall biosynthesis